MEIMPSFAGFEKPVISDMSEMKINPIAITDIPFIPKMQKGENQLNRSSP